MIKSKYPPYGKRVQERLSENNLPDLFMVCPLFFFSCPEIHIFSGDAAGWNRAKHWSKAGYLVLVMPENEKPELYKFPVLGCFVFIHMTSLNNFISTLVGEVVANGAIGYQMLLYSVTSDTPGEQIVEIAGELCQKSTAVLHQEYYKRAKR